MVGLCVFFVCTVSLLVGYIVYGRLAERVYGLKLDMVMPCVSRYDGVDYVALPTWKIFLIQLLNIAGLGPVVGAVSGCLFGPIALLWIVLGCLFAGAVHDFLAALLSLEYQGAGLPDVMGKVMGKRARQFFSLVCVFLLVMVGVVFTLLPAGMLQTLLPAWGLNVLGWSSLIMLYYFLATILPIHTIIGRIYPLFGAIFLIGNGVATRADSYGVKQCRILQLCAYQFSLLASKNSAGRTDNLGVAQSFEKSIQFIGLYYKNRHTYSAHQAVVDISDTHQLCIGIRGAEEGLPLGANIIVCNFQTVVFQFNKTGIIVGKVQLPIRTIRATVSKM